jgi:hypothetical protein
MDGKKPKRGAPLKRLVRAGETDPDFYLLDGKIFFGKIKFTFYAHGRGRYRFGRDDALR